MGSDGHETIEPPSPASPAASATLETIDRTIYEELLHAVQSRRRRCEQLRRVLEHLEAQTAADEHMLMEMEGVLGFAAQMRLEQLDSHLRGQRLLEVAIDLLARHVEPDSPIHYRAWFALLQDAGHQVAGKDPLATFLAQISRASEVEPVGRRSGLYRLRDAPSPHARRPGAVPDATTPVRPGFGTQRAA